MYQNVSAAFTTALNRASRTFRSKITVNGNSITDIKSYTLVSGSCGSEVFSLGTVFSSYVNITMPVQEITLAGQEFLLETGIKLDNGTFEYIPMGYYTANPSDIVKSRDQIVIKASDRITSKCRGSYVPSVTFPATIQAIIDDIESQAGIAVVTSLSTTGTVENSFPMMLCYEALGYIAGLLGGFCYAARNGNICIAAYPVESDLDVSGDRIFQLSVNESEYTLNRIAVTVSPGGENADGEEVEPVVYTAGSGDGIDLYNPFMTQTLFTAMSGRMRGYSFFPGTVSFLGDPRLDPIDALAAENYEETEFLIPCMNIEQTFDGGLKTTITAPGIVSSDQAAQGPLSQQVEKMEADMMLANEVIAKKISADEANIRYGVIEKAVIGSASISDLSVAKLNFNTAVGQLFTADQVIALNAAFDSATVGTITADSINTARASFESVLAGSFTAEEIGAAAAEFRKALIQELYVANLDANYAHITNGVIDNATIGHAGINGLEANYAKIDAANIDTASVRNAWIDELMVQSGLISHQGVIYELDAIQVNASKIKTGTLDVERLIVTQNGQKYLVHIDPTTGSPSYQKLDGNVIEDLTITADKIVAGAITAQKITTENISGSGGWINLRNGTFSYINATTGQGISWDGEHLNIAGAAIFDSYSLKSETVSNVVVEYAKSTSPTSQPSSGWSTATPTWEEGKYIWQRTGKTINGQTTYTYACIQGTIDGTNLFCNTAMTDQNIVAASNTDYTKPFRMYNGSAGMHTFSEYSAGIYQDTISLNSGTNNLGIAFVRLASDIDLDPDSYYTLSCWAKTSLEGAKLSIGISYFKTDDTGVWRGGTNLKPFDAVDTWQFFTHTFKPDSNTKATCYCFTVNGSSGSGKDWTIRNCKLEKGTVATSWSLAPEDALGQVQQVYIRTNSNSIPNGPTNIVSINTNVNNQWTTRRLPMIDTANTAYKYCYTCEQLISSYGCFLGHTAIVQDEAHTVIDGGNIITGTVTANKIAANSITANKIKIGDFNNYITATELDSSTLCGGTLSDGWIYKDDASASNVWLSPVLNQWSKAGEQYRITGIVKAPAIGRCIVLVYGRDASGTAINNAYTECQITTANQETSFNSILTITNVVANQPKINVAIRFVTSSNENQAGYCKQMRMERMSAGDLIVDGALTIGKIDSTDQTKILNSEISVGGRNLLIDTKTMASWGVNNGTIISNGVVTFPTVTANTWRECWETSALPYSLVRNKAVTMSCLVRATSGMSCSINLCLGVSSNQYQHTRSTYANKQVNFTGTGSWEKISTTVDITDSYFSSGSGANYETGNVCFRPGAWFTSWNGFEAKEFKLETGNVATEWTPAIEDATYTRVCQVGNSSNTATNYWRKFASCSCSYTYIDPYIIFDVSETGDMGNSHRFGRLKAHFRTAGTSGTTDGTPTLQWLYRGDGINDLTYFAIAYKATSGSKVDVELWCQCVSTYRGFRFGVVEEGDRLNSKGLTNWWTLYDDWTADGSSAITNGYTVVYSTDIDAARKSATDYITRIDENGIWVTPSNKKPTNTSTGAGATGTKIDGNGVGIYKDGVSVAQYGEVARIGDEEKSHIELDYRSLKLIDNQGLIFFETSDLVDSDGYITDKFLGDDNETRFELSCGATSTNYSVKVNGTETTSGITKYSSSVEFSTRPTTGTVIEVYYIPNREGVASKAYTLGMPIEYGAKGLCSIREGIRTLATGEAAHAEGWETKALGNCSHSEGKNSISNGHYGHAEGAYTIASQCGHAEGYQTEASYAAHAEGYETKASGYYSHAQNHGTETTRTSQTVIGEYNIIDTADMTSTYFPEAAGNTNIHYGEYAFIIGNGEYGARSNALTVDWNGVVDAKGGYKVNSYTPIVIETVTADNINVNGNSLYTWDKTGLTKTGYTLAGVVGFGITNATTSGTNSSLCTVYYCRKNSASSIQMLVRNTGSASSGSANSYGTAKVKLTADLLWIVNGMI